MREEINKIKCSTGRSEEAMRRTKNRILDFIGFEGYETINSEKKLTVIPAFPEECPGFW